MLKTLCIILGIRVCILYTIRNNIIYYVDNTTQIYQLKYTNRDPPCRRRRRFRRRPGRNGRERCPRRPNS